MAKLGFLVGMEDYFGTFLVGKDWTGRNVLVACDALLELEHGLPLNIPDENAHLADAIISLTEIMFVLCLPTSSQKQTFGLLCLFTSNINPSLPIFAPLRLAEYIILNHCPMDFLRADRLEGVDFFEPTGFAIIM